MTHEKPEKASFVIVHDYQEAPGVCMPGEEIVAIILIYQRKRYRVPLSPTHLILMDFLARCRYPEDAWRISARIQSDPFSTDHGLNAPGHRVRPARSSRVAVRQQVKRIRAVLSALIAEERLNLDAKDIIRSEETSTRLVRYVVNANVTWDHLPLPGSEELISDFHAPRIHAAPLGSEVGNRLRMQW